MNLEEYQKRAHFTADYPQLGGRFWVYPALKISGEAGEVSEMFGKIIRDKLKNNPEYEVENDDEAMASMKKELGDVLWYVAEICTVLGFSLEDVAETNLKKLMNRKLQNKIHGSGSDR